MKFIGIDAPGALQASWTVPAFTVHALPPSVDLRLAALAEPLAVACHDVRRGELAAGETALVIGGGPIGTLIAIVARAGGARALVVELDERRRALAQELGLDARALAYGVAHGALAMTTPGDTSMATLGEVERLVAGRAVRVER